MAEVLAALNANEAWVELLYTRFKIEVSGERQQALFRGLSDYAVSLCENTDSLFQRAYSRQINQNVWAQIIHLATNHETRFYRNPSVVGLVANLAKDFQRPRILSIGCSTGEEPYSFAVELSEQGLANYHVHGTDVSAPCIEIASTGVYPVNELIPEKYAPRCTASHSMFFTAKAKGTVSFEQHNVLGYSPINFANPNIIITQHMLIYYRVRTRLAILNSLSCLLAPGGYLITAAAEEANWNPDGFERHHNLPATVFRKHV
jgi:type IV pilus assembly protein PilK